MRNFSFPILCVHMAVFFCTDILFLGGTLDGQGGESLVSDFVPETLLFL